MKKFDNEKKEKFNPDKQLLDDKEIDTAVGGQDVNISRNINSNEKDIHGGNVIIIRL